ncbi:B12-binding domain-containing radical SAM protein [bacterium]|nr:B12-binding domain-containing radical SAM protein [bacterium]
MRVMFINKGETMQELLGPLYIAAALKKHGHSVDLALLTQKNFWQSIRRFNPDILTYSTTTGLHHDYLALNRELKKRSDRPDRVLSIFGGPHPTFFPEMIEHEGVDAVCIGEGDEAIVDFVERFERGTDFEQTPNFWVKTRTGIIKNQVRPLIEDLDSIPFPDRELLYARDAFLRRNPVKTVITGRGCPNKCTYCFNHSYHKIYHKKGKIIRHRSVPNLMLEIKEIVDRYPLAMLGFVDDNFLLTPDWLEEFAQTYPSSFSVPFYCGVHAAQVNEKNVTLLKKAGCQAVYMGIEAGDDYIRTELLKRRMSRDQIVEAARLVRSAGLKLFAQNMLGFPGSTLETDLRTLLLNIEAKPSFSWVSLYQPYPRTELGEYAVKNGYYQGNLDELMPSYHLRSELIFSSEAEKKQIERLHHFFDAMVKFPRLMPFFLFLTRLPFDRTYLVFYKLWFGYNVRRRVFRYRLDWRDFLATVWRFLHNTHMPRLSQIKK